MKASPAVLFVSVGGLAVIAAIVTGFMINGAPRDVRMRRLDQQRVRDLQILSTVINGYRRTRNRLPDSLQAMEQSGRVAYWRTEDVETRAPYEYRVKDESSFELCAQFDVASGEDEPADFWKHGAGRKCFTLDVDSSNRQYIAPEPLQ